MMLHQSAPEVTKTFRNTTLIRVWEFVFSLDRPLVCLATIVWAPVMLLTACNMPVASLAPKAAEPLAKKLIYYSWEEDMPDSVLAAFSREYGVEVEYLVYESQEKAIENMRSGLVYDVVVMDNQFIPELVQDDLLAKINHQHVPNLKNILINFRDLAYDPGNRYAIPYSWGTAGLLVRSDLVSEPVSQWADLWKPVYAGKIMMWRGVPREWVGLTLMSLGYSPNSENPVELEQTLNRLLALKPNLRFVDDFGGESAYPFLASGEAVLGPGYSYEALSGREENEAIQYIIPEEGALLWGDNFVIPANSPNKYTAELFLNFMLRPEISAQITNENMYATPNEAAMPLLEPAIREDRVVFPTNVDLQNAKLLLPLSPAGRELHSQIWERFLAAGQQSRVE